MAESGDGKTVVITGISSFIGVHLALTFRRAGFKVVGTYLNEKEFEDSLRKERLEAARSAGVQLAALDFTDYNATGEFVQKFRPDYWVQHAGWAVAYGSKEYDLAKSFEVNVYPLRPLFEALSAAGCKGILITGTSAEYSDSDHACKETDACYPSMPYGLSKYAESVRAMELAQDTGLKTRIARVFIPYGIMDVPQKLVPSVITSLIANESVDLSPCEQKRDFMSVQDLANGYLALIADLDRDPVFDIFNVCSGESRQLKDFLLSLAAELGRDPSLLKFGAREMRPGEPEISFGSNEKALSLLNWAPRPLEAGIQEYLSQVQSS